MSTSELNWQKDGEVWDGNFPDNNNKIKNSRNSSRDGRSERKHDEYDGNNSISSLEDETSSLQGIKYSREPVLLGSESSTHPFINSNKG